MGVNILGLKIKLLYIENLCPLSPYDLYVDIQSLMCGYLKVAFWEVTKLQRGTLMNRNNTPHKKDSRELLGPWAYVRESEQVLL